MPAVVLDSYQCIQCGCCVAVCPNALFEAESPQATPRPVEGADQRCISCHHCVAICPVGCITVGTVDANRCDPVPKESVPRFEHIETLVRTRRSIRRFLDKPVERAVLDQLLDVVRWAPTARNLLPVRWLVINDRDTMRDVGNLMADWARTTDWGPPLADAWDHGVDHFLRGAPCLAVAYTGADAVWGPIDATIAVETLDLCAVAKRLGACWAGFFIIAAQNHEPLRRRLALEDGQTVQGGLMLGYTDIEIYPRIPYRPELDVRFL